MSRRLDPIKVGATKILLFAFVDERNVVIPMASGKITIWDPSPGGAVLVNNAVVTLSDGRLQYVWTAPAINGSRRTCHIEFMGITVSGAVTYKSGADGRGDLEIDILASHTS